MSEIKRCFLEFSVPHPQGKRLCQLVAALQIGFDHAHIREDPEAWDQK